MKQIPQEYVDEMPEAVAPTRESCEAAANATLVVLFLDALASSVEDEDIYRPLELEDETKRAYYLAAGIER